MADFKSLQHRWGWFLALGILLVVLGIVALAYTAMATVGVVLVLGWLMFFSGIVEGVHAFHARRWGGVLLHIGGGALGILIGLPVVTHPVAGVLAWTLLFASFLTVIGVFRLVVAVWLRYRSWGWAVLDGLVTLVLGVLLWAGLPWSGLWFLGFALGIALILRGWSTIMFSFAVRKVGNIVALRPAACAFALQSDSRRTSLFRTQRPEFALKCLKGTVMCAEITPLDRTKNVEDNWR